jgi:cytochrome c551/c552
MIRIAVAFLLAAGVGGALVLPHGAEPQAKPSPLPGVTGPDGFPKGCVSCHIVASDGDKRLPTLLKSVKKHPAMGTVKTVPQDCIRCHKAAVKSIPFADSTHKSHYGKMTKSLFVERFRGDCLHCHAFDTKTGAMSVKSGPKNW